MTFTAEVVAHHHYLANLATYLSMFHNMPPFLVLTYVAVLYCSTFTIHDAKIRRTGHSCTHVLLRAGACFCNPIDFVPKKAGKGTHS
jgi:hypothetical protein